ncbi:MAG: hypothetical protein M3P70_04020 [Actinomycetota bacterium]|nr:hypothetical protein [Actinomycetota bacterium]
MSETTLAHVKRLVVRLSRAERVRLATWLETTLDDRTAGPPRHTPRSLYGLCADLGTGPTDADIDEARRELWGTFPREGIA